MHSGERKRKQTFLKNVTTMKGLVKVSCKELLRLEKKFSQEKTLWDSSSVWKRKKTYLVHPLKTKLGLIFNIIGRFYFILRGKNQSCLIFEHAT